MLSIGWCQDCHFPKHSVSMTSFLLRWRSCLYFFSFPPRAMEVKPPCLAFGMNIGSLSVKGCPTQMQCYTSLATLQQTKALRLRQQIMKAQVPHYLPTSPQSHKLKLKMASPLTVLLKRGYLQKFIVPHSQDTSSSLTQCKQPPQCSGRPCGFHRAWRFPSCLPIYVL